MDTVEVFASDEHRLGLKPVTRRVWAPVGERPIAPGHHRFDWLYVTAFVSPASGETFWYVHDGVSKPFFAALLETFAREAGAGARRTIVLVLDNAGWHGEAGLDVPDGVRLVFLPPYTPELQPAETLWALVDEPIINKHVATIDELDDIIGQRCAALANERDAIKSRAGFHWWPKIIAPKRLAGNRMRPSKTLWGFFLACARFETEKRFPGSLPIWKNSLRARRSPWEGRSGLAKLGTR